jgi:hypothetical protein
MTHNPMKALLVPGLRIDQAKSKMETYMFLFSEYPSLREGTRDIFWLFIFISF